MVKPAFAAHEKYVEENNCLPAHLRVKCTGTPVVRYSISSVLHVICPCQTQTPILRTLAGSVLDQDPMVL